MLTLVVFIPPVLGTTRFVSMANPFLRSGVRPERAGDDSMMFP